MLMYACKLEVYGNAIERFTKLEKLIGKHSCPGRDVISAYVDVY